MAISARRPTSTSARRGVDVRDPLRGARSAVNPAVLDRLAPRAVIDGCRAALLRTASHHATHIAVTSALRGEGRSTVALGIALVQRREFRRKTLLVELDLERPRLAARLGVEPTPGLAELLRDQAPLDACIRTLDEDLTLLPAGDATYDAAPLIADLIARDHLRQLQLWCEVMVADLPPVLSTNATAGLAAHFPKLMLVVRAGATPAPRVREAIADLPSQPAVMLNSLESRLPRWIGRLSGS